MKSKPELSHLMVERYFIPSHKIHLHVHKTYVKVHKIKRNGTSFKIKGHWLIHHIKLYDQKGKEVNVGSLKLDEPQLSQLHKQVFEGYMKRWHSRKWLKGKSEDLAKEEAAKWASGVVGKLRKGEKK